MADKTFPFFHFILTKDHDNRNNSSLFFPQIRVENHIITFARPIRKAECLQYTGTCVWLLSTLHTSDSETEMLLTVLSACVDRLTSWTSNPILLTYMCQGAIKTIHLAHEGFFFRQPPLPGLTSDRA